VCCASSAGWQERKTADNKGRSTRALLGARDAPRFQLAVFQKLGDRGGPHGLVVRLLEHRKEHGQLVRREGALCAELQHIVVEVKLDSGALRVCGDREVF
jgi:hypothetical protein